MPRISITLCALLLLTSLSTAAHASVPPAPAVSDWVLFQDAAEQAFQLQVPKGWKITGGTYRFGPLDPRIMIDMISPDGKIDVRIGDYRVPPFATLSRTLRQLGWGEGHPYNPRNMAQQIIANYRPGWVFADIYGQARFSSMCAHLRLKSMQKAEPLHPSAGSGTTTAGEALYSCESNAGPQAAYVFAETQLTMMQDSGVWLASWLYSFIAPQNQAADAMKIVWHSLSTFEISPQWYSKQLQINGQASGAIMQDFKRTMGSIQQDYQRRSAASQSQFDAMDRAIRGVDLTTDPVDGKQREVWTGTGAQHWINNLNQVVDSPFQPSPDARRLGTAP